MFYVHCISQAKTFAMYTIKDEDQAYDKADELTELGIYNVVSESPVPLHQREGITS